MTDEPLEAPAESPLAAATIEAIDEFNATHPNAEARIVEAGEPRPDTTADTKPKRSRKAAPDLPPSPGDDGKARVIQIPAGTLKEALAGIGAVIERRNTIPILSNLRIEAVHGRASLTGTDLDLQCVRMLDVEQDMDAPAFATTVCEATLEAIVKKIDGEAMVTLTLSPGKMLVTAGRARFTLPTLPIEDFPMMLAGGADHQFELAAFDLAAMIDGVRFAMSTEETRYYLNGIYLHATTTTGPTGDGDGTLLVLRGVATDGHRLARYDLPQPDGAGALDGVIIPRKAIGVLDKMLDGFEGPVDVAICTGKAVFDFGDVVLTTKLVDGTFPDYTRVIPTGNYKILLIDPKSLAAAAERVKVMASDKTRLVRMDLSRDLVTLTCRSPELGEAREECPCDHDCGDGDALTIGFDGRYLADVLGRIQGDTMRAELADGSAPVLIRDSNNEARGLYVLMPMRV
jgi:DNA polymerase-3 subunit beta